MWLLPSRGRPQKLKACLDGAVAAGMVTPGRVLIDESDMSKDEYLKMTLPKDWEFYIVPALLEEPHPSQGKSIRNWIKENKAYCDNCAWIGLFSDDHVFITKGWDVMMLEEAKGLRMICTNDRWRAIERTSGASLWTGDLFRAVGQFIFPANICHMYVDNIWETIGLNTGTWCVHMGVIIEHDHWSKKKDVQPDETTVYAESFLMKDKAACTEYMNTEIVPIINRVKYLNMHSNFPTGIHLFMTTAPGQKRF